MRLINNDHRFCCPQCVKRTIKTLCAVIVIITPQESSVSAITLRVAGQKLHVYQENINLLRVLTTTFNKITHHTGEIAASLLSIPPGIEHLDRAN